MHLEKPEVASGGKALGSSVCSRLKPAYFSECEVLRTTLMADGSDKFLGRGLWARNNPLK